jgi:hypothetical protein
MREPRYRISPTNRFQPNTSLLRNRLRLIGSLTRSDRPPSWAVTADGGKVGGSKVVGTASVKAGVAPVAEPSVVTLI